MAQITSEVATVEHCKQEHRLNEVEKDIRELQKCAIELKEGHAET